MFVTENLSEFIDFEKKKCDFDNTQFISILEFIKDNGLDSYELQKAKDEMYNNNEVNKEEHQKYLKRFEDNSCYVEKTEFGNFSDPASFVQNSLNSEICLKGIPASNGNGVLVCGDIVAAISEKSDKKDAAWGFVRGLLTDGFQAGITSSYPINTAVFDYYLQNEQTDTSAENFQGEYTDVKPLDAVTTESLVNSVSGASRAVVSDSNVTEIINQQAYKFFDSSQSAENAAKEIQSKVLSYLKTIK